jgi:cytochrome P450
MAARNEVDLAAEYSYQLPVRVIHEILTVPEDQRQIWRDAAMGSLVERHNPKRLVEAVRRLVEPTLELVRLHRAEQIDDLLSDLIQIHDEQEGGLTTAELVATTMAMVLSGFSTTSWFISGSVWALLTHPDQLRLLISDPGAVPGATDELMRWLSPVDIGTKRYATAQVEVGGIRIEPGEAAVPLLASANRDERGFPGADVLDLRRSGADRHVALGHGAHYCLGAALAKLEGEIAITRLFARFPDLRLTVSPQDVAPRLLQGVLTLPVALT